MNLFNDTTLSKIRNILLERNETVAVAESVTSGLIQFALSQTRNVSDFFEGGVTAYNVGQEAKQLNVSPILALSCDSISVEVSEKMALQVSQHFMSTYGLAITGYATLAHENKSNTLYAFVSIAYENKVVFSERIEAGKNIEEGFNCQLYFTQKLLDLFLDILQKQ